MGLVLDRVATVDKYPPERSGGAQFDPVGGVKQINWSEGGTGDFFAQFAVPIPKRPGKFQWEQFEHYYPLSNSGAFATGVYGVRFRSATLGTPATITADLIYENDPVIVTGAPTRTAVVPATVILPATVLPGSPTDGQQAILVDSVTVPTWSWLLQWSDAAAEWIFLGGSSLRATVNDATPTTIESTASAAYTALATAGPAVTLPRPGRYRVQLGAFIISPNSAAAIGYMSYDIGGTGAVDADALASQQEDANTPRSAVMASRVKVKAGLTAVTLTAKYRTTAGTVNFGVRSIDVVPVGLT